MSNQLTKQDELILRAFTQLNPDKVTLVECEPMPNAIRQYVESNRIIAKECYCNSAKSVLSLMWSDDFAYSVQYVLGVADMGIGFHGHAWIEVSGVHHDPTFEVLNSGIEGRKYFEVCRFTPDELIEFLVDNENIPPCFPEHAPREVFDFDWWRTIKKNMEPLRFQLSA